MLRGKKVKTGKTGKIIPNGVSLQKHENDIVVVFTEMGKDVELIPTARSRGRKTADAIIDGLEWEFKTPVGGSTRSIDHLLRKAAVQSCNIVIDLRLHGVYSEQLLKRVRYTALKITTLRRVKVIMPSEKIIDIK